MANQTKEQWSEKFFATPVGVALYPSLSQPKAWEGQEPKYEISLVFDASKKDALAPLLAEQEKIAQQAFGAKVSMDSLKLCFKVQTAEDGTKFLVGKFRTKNKPQVAMFDRSTCSGDSILSGDLVRVSFKFASGSYAGNKYVKGVMFGVQKIGTGGVLPEGVGRSAPKIEDMFDEVEPIGLASINSEEW